MFYLRILVLKQDSCFTFSFIHISFTFRIHSHFTQIPVLSISSPTSIFCKLNRVCFLSFLTELTGLHLFFTFFIIIANFCLFCQKGKSSVLTALPFFLLFFVTPLSTHWGIHIPLQFDLTPRLLCLTIKLLVALFRNYCHYNKCQTLSFLPHCPPLPALMCRCRSTASSSVDIAIRGSHRKPPKSSSPIRCIRRLSSMSLVAVVSRWGLVPSPLLFAASSCVPSSISALVIHCHRRPRKAP